MSRPIPRYRWPVTVDGETIGHLTLPTGPDQVDTDDFADQCNVTADGEFAVVEARLTVAESEGALAIECWRGEADPAELAAVVHAWADHLARTRP